jgi:prephenate dehydratase
LNNSRVRILKHIELPIHHCVIGLTTDLAEVKKIISHPAALAQCQKFLQEHSHMEVQEWYDTAGAARDVANGKDASLAAIAPKRCAELLGLMLLRENIEDSPDNRTTFVLVGR